MNSLEQLLLIVVAFGFFGWMAAFALGKLVNTDDRRITRLISAAGVLVGAVFGIVLFA